MAVAESQMAPSGGSPEYESGLANWDLQPTGEQQRTWNWWTYTALWIGMAHCVPTWMLAGGLIDVGLTWWQAIVLMLVGNLIVLAPIVLNAHAGTKYCIPFPVFARAAFGVRGANIPAVARGAAAG